MFSDAPAVSIERSALKTIDINTVIVVVLLTVAGLLSILSATATEADPMSSFFNKQAMYAVVGMVAMVGIMYIPERLLSATSWWFYGLSIALLVAVLVAGKVVYGSKSWLALGPITFQPSELGKLATLFAMADFLQRPNVSLRSVSDLLRLIGIVALPVALIMGEPDFGSATVYAVMLVGVMLWSGADLLLLYGLITPPVVALVAFFGTVPMYIALGVAVAGALAFRRSIVLTLAVIALNVGAGFSTGPLYDALKPHQKSRIQSFLDPNTDPLGKGYHVIQSKIAIGSGGIAGKGFRQGTQTQLRYIPKQWTDFIFCVPAEEFGFLGGSFVIALLGLLCWRTVMIASEAKTKFASVVSAGIATIWFYHTTINIGMAVGLMPVMGIPLPFLSAGGSSLVVNLAMVGLLLNFHRVRATRKPV